MRSCKKMRGGDKHRLLHGVALEAEDDSAGAAGQYLTAYAEKDIDDVIAEHKWSVEHVLPRSMVNGSASGHAEKDPLGWVEATRRANQRRSNLPLVLWPGGGGGRVWLEGELHYAPPEQQRARLARKWLFLRATYSVMDFIDAPSKAQLAHMQHIVDLAREGPVGIAEQNAHDALVRVLGGEWRNPLLNEQTRQEFLSDARFRTLLG